MAGDILNEIWQCPPQWVWIVFNSFEFVGGGRWVIVNSPEPPSRARVKLTPFGCGCKYLIHCTYISDEVLWTCSQRWSDTLNKTNRKTEIALCVLNLETHCSGFFLFFPFAFFRRALESANLQMQSIALVLSQIDFSSVLWHLGRPSLALTECSRCPFAAILQPPFCAISNGNRH